MKRYYVYILSNKRNTVLYTGVTNNLRRRVAEHKNKTVSGFSARYNVNKLVYYETFKSPVQAIAREKQIKAGSRAAKERLIKSMNPEYKDLSESG
jgi:putative endonuclease